MSFVLLRRLSLSTGFLDLDDLQKSPFREDDGQSPFGEKDGFDGSEEAPSAIEEGRPRG
jgi:hypothetical protein